MGTRVDLTGQTFGRLTVDEYAGTLNQKSCYYCNCECGAFILVKAADLKNGKQKSCGCLNRELARARKLKHGGCLDRRNKGASVEFQAWMNIKGKKLPMVPEWLDYKNFFRDVGWRPSEKHQLTRLDINEPYGPENFKWRHPDEINERRNLGLADDLGFCIDDILMDSGSTEATEERREVPAGADWTDTEERSGVVTAGKELANVGW